jgi:hypothetical protein
MRFISSISIISLFGLLINSVRGSEDNSDFAAAIRSVLNEEINKKLDSTKTAATSIVESTTENAKKSAASASSDTTPTDEETSVNPPTDGE